MSRPDQPPAHAAFRDFPLNAWYAAAWDRTAGLATTDGTQAAIMVDVA